MNNDTITAIATPIGKSALGIIRISGYDSFNILNTIFKTTTSDDIINKPSHRIYHGHILDPRNNGSYTDEVLVSVMKAPNTYTREDTVEISSHGNPVILNKILDIILKTGARLAEPGEFTKRAFLNGRLDLSQAEAVMDLINAKSESAVNSALRHNSGHLSSYIKHFQHTIHEILISIEARIDFPEDNTSEINISSISYNLEHLIFQINNFIDTYTFGNIIKSGFNVFIVGKANVGKSTLFNLLSEKPGRALVTHIPGTTRDIIEESFIYNGRLFNISDTAGIKIPRGNIEKESLKITKNRINNAHIIIFVIDGSKQLSIHDKTIADLIIVKPAIIVINKHDLPQKINISKVESLLNNKTILQISCKDNMNINLIKNNLLELSGNIHNDNISSEILITNQRHKILLENASSNLHNALSSIKNSLSTEFLSSDLQNALQYLQEITGENVSENLLSDIFSRFCIGK